MLKIEYFAETEADRKAKDSTKIKKKAHRRRD